MFTDEERGVTGIQETRDVFISMDAAFADTDDFIRKLLRETQRSIERDLESTEVAIVDADDAGSGSDGAGQFLIIMNLNEDG